LIIYPAIDIKEGKCVRLYQGKMERVTVFSEDPSEMARRWEDAGAQFIHIVDLDGAVAGKPQNLRMVERIINAVEIPAQLGGGIRDSKSLKSVLDLGVRRVILGTTAIKSPEFVMEACGEHGSHRIVVGIDFRNEKVAIRGWEESAEEKAVDVAKRMEEIGVEHLICTDIERDGTLHGPNIEIMRTLAQAVSVPIIASGGISGLKDIECLKELEPLGIEGVVVGRALYAGAFSLEEAIEIGRG
jgi:phosphoribosylformimino-5-aminoimidazole carboxamide ribotide isomerase